MIQRQSEQGITIIETTVILSVLFILAGVLSPIVSESVTTARAVKAKNDASMIAMGLINLQKDLGGDALAYGGDAPAFSGPALAAAGRPTLPALSVRLPDVLVSAGGAPHTEELEAGPREGSLPTVIGLFAQPGTRERDGGARPVPEQRRRWLEVGTESLDDHLRTNRKGYRLRQPGEYGGWNGPYVSAELKGDPWGTQYMVNTLWLDGGSTAADSQGRARHAVFVISAGGNGVIETPFEQPITDARAYGDDIVIRIQ